MLNAPVTGQLWGLGGSISYPLTGPPIAVGTTLTITRILPLTQSAEISNQGNQYPVVTEQALDTLCMEIQQVSARTGQQRGTWVSGIVYNFGDVVQDGVNGSNSGNYYMCAIANTSGTWTTDLGNGDWSLVIQAMIPVTPIPIPVVDGGTGATTPGAALNNLGGISLSGNNAFTGNNTHTGTETFTGGSIAVSTAGAGDSSSKAASTAFVNGTALTLAAGTTAVTQSSSDNSTKVATTAQVAAKVAASVIPANGSSLVLLAPTQTASSSAAITFSGIPSGYDKYIIEFTNVIPVTNGGILGFKVGAVSTNYSWALWAVGTSGGSGAHTSATDSTRFAVTFDGISNTAAIGASGHIDFYGLSSSNQTEVISDYTYYNGTNTNREMLGGRQAGVGGPFTSISAAMNSGNILSGTFSLYGVAR